MKHRKPFNVKPFAVCHNAIMFFLSFYMVVETLSQSYVNFGWAKKFTPWGNMVENPGSSKFSPSGYRLARVLWIHYLSKVYEFADTAIMVLKKNERQISFLHVYHHASTFFPCWWAAVNFAPGGDVYFICALNSFVHVLMYGYYLASSLNLKVPSIFKRSITKVQMIQFGLLNAQALYGVFVASYYRPRIVVVMALIQSVVFMTLFANFYRQAYKKSAAAAAAAKKGGSKKRA
jgi:GNS1/SUR4 family